MGAGRFWFFNALLVTILQCPSSQSKLQRSLVFCAQSREHTRDLGVPETSLEAFELEQPRWSRTSQGRSPSGPGLAL